jgi:tetratricopeptide (TPR) repeat protein
MADLTLKSQYENLLRLAQAGQHEQAVDAGRRILEAFPKYVCAYAVLGQVHLEMGRQLEAAALFHRVLSADPEHAGAYGCLGAIYEAQGLPDEALWQLYRAVELDPAHQGYRQILKRVARTRGMAIDRLKMTRGGLARAYLRGQLYHKSIAEMRDALADEPYRLDLQAALAEALWRQGDVAQAADVCERLLIDLPHCLKANLILGQAWLGSDRDPEARACLQRAQALDPDNVMAQALFGEASPLPPRSARIPLRGQEPNGRDRSELFGGEEDAEAVTIEGMAHQPEPAFLSPRPRPAPSAPGPASPAGERTPVGDEAALGDASASPWEARRQHVAEHPQDHAARLALARRLRDMGILDQALGHYAALADEAPTLLFDVAHDLELLTRLYPTHEGLRGLLQRVRADVGSLSGY